MNLEFGKHFLSTFKHPSFSHLALKEPPVERRNKWLVSHEGRNIEVLKEVDRRKLLQVLRDPVHKGNLLALRKENLHDPFGNITLYTVSKSGNERHVGHAILERRGEPDLPHLTWVGVVPYALRSKRAEDLLLAALERTRKKLEDRLTTPIRIGETRINLHQLDFLEKRLKGGLRDEVIVPEDPRMLLAAFENFQVLKGLKEGRAVQEPGLAKRKIYSYRGHRLGPLLISVEEELARMSGAKGMTGDLDISSTGRFLQKFGWVPEGLDTSSRYVRFRKAFE